MRRKKLEKIIVDILDKETRMYEINYPLHTWLEDSFSYREMIRYLLDRISLLETAIKKRHIPAHLDQDEKGRIVNKEMDLVDIEKEKD